MVDEPETPEQSDSDDSKKPDPGPTKRLDKAIEDMESGDIVEGTLVDIHAGTAEVPRLGEKKDEPSVSGELKKHKGAGGSGTPDVQPAATMYEPTQPGHVSAGSDQQTMYGPTGAAGTPQSGSLNAPSGPRPIAPFGGKIVVGTRIGQIEVTGVLGKGGMGEVFKGYHQALDINVAIKVLPDELSRNELVRQRFLREARLCVKLDHPHIVRVYNVDEYAGNLYLVMEMIEGTDAANMLKNGGRFRYKRALEIGAACADALAYAHTQGLVHRDVKPHNILLGATDGKIKLSDFGLARAATSSSHLTMSGQIMGTPHYMSPEQAEAKEVTDKSDVYSLGVSLYHMLTGETPFVGDTPISVAVQHIAKEIIYPEIRFKPFPKELVAVLKRMTAKDPAKRCSAKQAAVWLRKLISMAPSDDVEVQDDQAMKSMAPVVRESQAFKAAAEERQQRDEHARELARTMLATIQEDSGRRPSVPPTSAEQAGQTATQAEARKGSGGLVAAVVIILLVLGGGGAAGWYFTIGPGAPKNKANNQAVVAVDNHGKGANNPPANAGGNIPPANHPPDNTGTNNPPANNAAGDDGGPDDGSSPPPTEDDPQIANYIEGALASITDANTLADLEAVKRKLDLAGIEIKHGKGSAAQRAKYDELRESYNVKVGYLGAVESFDKIRAALEAFKQKRASDHAAAISQLNSAIAERDGLLAMNVPPDAEQLVAPEREALVEKVNNALDDFWSELDTEAQNLEDKEQYTNAEAILAELASIHNTPQKVQAVTERLQAARLHAIYATIRADLQVPDYQDALDQLKQAERLTVPDSLKAEHKKVTESGGLALEAAGNDHLQGAGTAADKGDYTTAHNELDFVGDLPGRTAPQKARYADAVYYVKLSEQVTKADTAIAGGDFIAARTALDAADAAVKDAEGRTKPTALLERLASVRGNFDAELAKAFDTLLAAAKSDMDKKDFAGAGKNLQAAGKLPYTPEQGKRLDAFKEQSRTALADFVRNLVAAIQKALDANDFDTASEKLESTKSLPIPDDQKDTLDKLRARFATEAMKRFGELLDTARHALDSKDYATADKSIADALKIPVSSVELEKAKNLRDKYTSQITDEVDRHLKRADELLHDDTLSEPDQFKKSKAELDAAAELHLPDDLDRQVKNKRSLWAKALEARFSKLLEDARTARENDLFEISASLLDQATALPLNNDQLVRAGQARDDHDAAVSAYKDKLFKQLDDCAQRGDEKAGRKIIDQIEAMGSLSPTEQLKLKRLTDALTGESETARHDRLPRYLQKLWTDRYCKPEQLIKIGEEITACAVTNDGKFGAAGTRSGKVYFYNLKRGTQLGVSSGGRRKITCIGFSPDGSMAACGNDDGAVVLYKISGTTVQPGDLGDVGDDVFGIAFTANGNSLFVATRDGQITRFNPRTKGKLGSFASGVDRAQCMQLSPDDRWLAVGGEDAKVALFDATSVVLKETLEAPGDDLIQRVAFSSDSSQLMAGSIGDSIGVWNLKRLTKKPNKEYKGLSEWIEGVGFSNDGRRCAAFDTEDRIVVWDAKSAIELRRLDYSDKLKGDKEFWASAGVIGADGTILIGTREGELLHMTLKSAG